MHDAQWCFEKGIKPPKVQVGDFVYVRFKYPSDPEKPFCRRVITKVETKNLHKAEYAFDKVVCTANNLYIGDDSFYLLEGERRATEDDFYLLGEIIEDSFFEDWNGRKIVLEYVDETE